jgi:hypothetical protein
MLWCNGFELVGGGDLAAHASESLLASFLCVVALVRNLSLPGSEAVAVHAAGAETCRLTPRWFFNRFGAAEARDVWLNRMLSPLPRPTNRLGVIVSSKAAGLPYRPRRGVNARFLIGSRG